MEREKSEASAVVVVEKEDIETEIKSGLDYNQILTHIGQFGKWQQRIFFWSEKNTLSLITKPKDIS